MQPPSVPPPISTQELAAFTRQLGAMLDAGVEVLRALRIASEHTGSAALVETAKHLGQYLEDGRELHQAVARHPETFGPFYVEMTRQGEEDGVLGRALLAVADYLDRLSPAAEGQASAAGAPPGPPPELASSTMRTLGTIALGAGGIWSLSAARLLPRSWRGPLSLFWSGACLLVGAARLEGARSGEPAPALPPALLLPPKTPERRSLETEAIVRGALDEQEEEAEPGLGGPAANDPARIFDDRDPLLGEDFGRPIDP